NPDGILWKKLLATKFPNLTVKYEDHFGIPQSPKEKWEIFTNPDYWYYSLSEEVGNIDLPHAYFHGSNLREIHAPNSVFPHANFRGANLLNANFYSSNLEEAVITDACLV